jgi:hypothetical protein
MVTESPSIFSNCLGQPSNKVAGASGNLGVNGTGVLQDANKTVDSIIKYFILLLDAG